MNSFRPSHSMKGARDVALKAFRTRFLSPFETDMNNRVQKAEHVRTKPRLIDMAATGGFCVTRQNKHK